MTDVFAGQTEVTDGTNVGDDDAADVCIRSADKQGRREGA